MARKTKEDAEKTRCSIIDSAEILFNEKGVSRTTLNDIALHAGITRGAVYWHFKNKIEIFDEMHMRITLPLEGLQNKLIGQPDPIASLRDFWTEAVLNMMSDDQARRVVNILFKKCEFVQELDDAAKRLETWSTTLICEMTAIFLEAGRKKLLREEIKAEVAAKYVYSFVTGIVYSWICNPGMGNLKTEVPPMMAMFFETLYRQEPG